MKTREAQLKSFIRRHHLQDVKWLATDASTRRYARVIKKGKSYILMDSPPCEKTKEFVLIDRILRKNGIHAPKIYAQNLCYGFLLLEDFGSKPLSLLVKDRTKQDDLYILALDTLIALQKKVKESNKLPLAYSQMLQENNLFLEYYVPHVLKKTLSSEAQDEFKKIWSKLFLQIRKLPKTIVLYDYHLNNLMLTDKSDLGLLDFQDALYGPIFYDLISLIEDERFPLPLTKRKKLLRHYLELRPVLANAKYADLIPVVAAHRHTRVLGMFARLAVKYKKPQYLQFAQNDWMFLRENIQSPLLKEYAAWLKKYLPQQIAKGK